MIDFSEHDLPAQKIAIYYSKTLGNTFAQKVMSLDIDITSPEEAEEITKFYWAMVNLAVEDQEEDKEIEGFTDLEYWMEKLLNIVMGYINRIGLGEYWGKVSDEINGR